MSRLEVNMHHFLNENVLAALFTQSIYTISDFLNTDLNKLSKIINLPYKDALAIKKHLVYKNSAVVQTSLTYYNELLRKSALLSSNISDLDTLLNGGLMTGNIYEFCGLPASGKTLFSLTLIKNIIQTLNQHVYYLDTRKSFSSKKLIELLDAEKCSRNDIGQVLSKVLVKQVNTHFELINALYEIKEKICNNFNIRLIVINSLPAVFYRNINYVKNYGMMNDLCNIMNLLTKEYHIVIVVINIVTTWCEGDFLTEMSYSEILGMGKYWKDVPQTRIMIKKTDEGSKYKFIIMNSNNER